MTKISKPETGGAHYWSGPTERLASGTLGWVVVLTTADPTDCGSQKLQNSNYLKASATSSPRRGRQEERHVATRILLAHLQASVMVLMMARQERKDHQDH